MVSDTENAARVPFNFDKGLFVSTRAFMSRFLIFVIILGSFLHVYSIPQTITLQGIVRDFSCFHPDFEAPVDWNSAQTGLFLPELSPYPDERPIFMPPALRSPEALTVVRSRQANVAPSFTPYAISNFGQYFHDEYYLDVPGVNIAIPIEVQLSLIDEEKGLYHYQSSGFFPINNEGYQRELLDTISLALQVDEPRTLNYWFTTEFRIRFFYRGGEVFRFLGDDDLWVFINGELTSCDLGSIHVALPCTIDLDSLGLLPNSTNEMLILHAERHWKGSSFELTTSVVPINLAPVVNDMALTLDENTGVTFELDGFDPDYNPNLLWTILSPPSFGSLSVDVNEWLVKGVKVTYLPNDYFTGNDSITFRMTDGDLSSSIATVRFFVNPVNNPPVALSSNYETTADSTLRFQLQATDVDTAPQDLRFYIVSTPSYGYVSIDDLDRGEVTYEAMNPGTEIIDWQVFDGTFFANGQTTIRVSENPVKAQERAAATGKLAGMVVGGVAFVAIVGVGITYLLFQTLAAKRFERIWEQEFKTANMLQNPLFKQATKEHLNPLYIDKNKNII